LPISRKRFLRQGTSLLFNLKKIHYVRSLKKFSEKDEPDFTVVKHLVKSGDHVVDIGANVGWYTRMLSGLVGDEGQVYSVEPISTTFKLLSYCVNQLRLRNVTLFNCGISEKDGSAMMEVPKYEGGGDNFYQARIVSKKDVDPSLKHYEVVLKSLDSLFSGLSNRISFIKCDVEGHEFQVVKSAKKLLANCKPAWLIEISGDPDSKKSEAFKLFNTFDKEGYKACWFDCKRLKKRFPGDKSVNYFFLTDNHISSMLRGNGSLLAGFSKNTACRSLDT